MKHQNTVALMSRIVEKAHRFIIEELETRGIQGLVTSHGAILSFLFHQNDTTMKELADKVHRSKPTVTVLVDKLVTLGYVLKEKSDSDSRVSYIRLTPKGRAFQKDFDDISQALNARVLKGISEKEIEDCGILLEKMLHNLL